MFELYFSDTFSKINNILSNVEVSNNHTTSLHVSKFKLFFTLKSDKYIYGYVVLIKLEKKHNISGTVSEEEGNEKIQHVSNSRSLYHQ